MRVPDGRHLGVCIPCHGGDLVNTRLLRWAAGYGWHRTWAIEDCRNLTRRLERDLLAAREPNSP
jgi:hypothetical protein